MRTTDVMRRMAAALLWIPAVAGTVRADQVALRTGRQYKLVSIQDLREGRLHYRTSGGQLMSSDLAEVTVVERARDIPFNEAEREFAAGRYAEAAEKYAAVRDNPDAPWTRRWALYRLTLCHEQTGRFAEAVGSYIALLGEVPEAGGSWVPAKWPDPSSTFLDEAAAHLDAALQAGGSAAATESLRKLREQIEGVRSAAGGGGGVLPGGDVEETTPWDRELEQMRAALARRAYGQVIEISDGLMAKGIDARLEWMLLWRGQAQMQVANEAEDYQRAALTLLRVVIHFPDSVEAGEAGYHAGVALERAGDAAGAAAVLREAAGRELNEELRAQVELSLRRVEGRKK